MDRRLASRRRPSPRWLGGVGIAATGIVCPCHVLTGLVLGAAAALGASTPSLPPAVQDGLHALYLPTAVLVGARLISGRAAARPARAAPPVEPAGR